jgi:protein-S-isoprenylcysteine O-methyltransferase Ste14
MSGNSQHSPNVEAGIAKRRVQVLIMLVFQAAILFLASGRLDWRWLWVYLGICFTGIMVSAAFMLRYSPETVALRASAENIETWDKVVGGLFAIMYFIVLLSVAGLDERHGWSGSLPLAVHLIGVITFSLGLALFIWAMVSNAHFATVVRVQKEREHRVCNQGPYRLVRHPGYIGAIFQSLALPLLLGSLWALIPGAIAALLLVVRTVLEDRTLRHKLPGYVEYTQQVRYRLVPGIW